MASQLKEVCEDGERHGRAVELRAVDEGSVAGTALLNLPRCHAGTQERAQHAHTPHGVARDGHTFVVP